jgi:hypothetical protein
MAESVSAAFGGDCLGVEIDLDVAAGVAGHLQVQRLGAGG